MIDWERMVHYNENGDWKWHALFTDDESDFLSFSAHFYAHLTTKQVALEFHINCGTAFTFSCLSQSAAVRLSNSWDFTILNKIHAVTALKSQSQTIISKKNVNNL